VWAYHGPHAAPLEQSCRMETPVPPSSRPSRRCRPRAIAGTAGTGEAVWWIRTDGSALRLTGFTIPGLLCGQRNEPYPTNAGGSDDTTRGTRGRAVVTAVVMTALVLATAARALPVGRRSPVGLSTPTPRADGPTLPPGRAERLESCASRRPRDHGNGLPHSSDSGAAAGNIGSPSWAVVRSRPACR
jgi:hypothetical protein